MTTLSKSNSALLLKAMPDRPVTGNQIQVMAKKFTRKTVKHALYDLRDEGLVDHVGGTYKFPLFQKNGGDLF